MMAIAFLVPPVAAAPKEDDRTTVRVRQYADPMVDNILAGMRFDDFQRYGRDFDPALKVLGFRTQFFEANRKIKAAYGDYVAREYLGALRRPEGYLVLWKGRFSRTPEQVLIKLELKQENKKYVVTGMWLE
jgi:hypothetical protein